MDSKLLKKIDLESERFWFCQEIIVKLIKIDIEIKTPISYRGRTAKNRKKVGLKDAAYYIRWIAFHF